MSIVVNVTFRFFMRSPFVELRQKYKILQRFGEKKLRCDNHPLFRTLRCVRLAGANRTGGTSMIRANPCDSRGAYLLSSSMRRIGISARLRIDSGKVISGSMKQKTTADYPPSHKATAGRQRMSRIRTTETSVYRCANQMARLRQ